MKIKQPKLIEPAVYKGTQILTDANIADKIKKYSPDEKFYEIDLAEVIKILTPEDVVEGTQQQPSKYPQHVPGAIQARLLYTQREKQFQQLLIMYPRSPFIQEIPVVGELVLCSQYPSQNLDTKQGVIFDQYYYFEILNILNNQNNNVVADVSIINQQEQPAQENQNLCGKNFYINNEVKHIKYEQGDVIFSGRYGHSIKFTNERGENNETMLPSIIISNENSECIKNDTIQNSADCGSLIRLGNFEIQPKDPFDIAASRTLLDEINSFSLIGNNILQYSDRIIINGRKNDVEIYANQNIQLSANSNLLGESQNIKLKAKKVIISVGSNEVIIDSSGVTINATKITLGGPTQISGITAGSTAGFCSLPICAFTGAPHTINIVGS